MMKFRFNFNTLADAEQYFHEYGIFSDEIFIGDVPFEKGVEEAGDIVYKAPERFFFGCEPSGSVCIRNFLKNEPLY